MSGKLRDPHPDKRKKKRNLVRQQCCKRRMEPLIHVDGSFLVEELSLGLGSLGLLLIPALIIVICVCIYIYIYIYIVYHITYL